MELECLFCDEAVDAAFDSALVVCRDCAVQRLPIIIAKVVLNDSPRSFKTASLLSAWTTAEKQYWQGAALALLMDADDEDDAENEDEPKPPSFSVN